MQTVLPSPERSTRVKQRAAKKATKAKKQPIKIEVLPSLLFRITSLEFVSLTQAKLVFLMEHVKQNPTRGKRKIILSSSESELEEQLKRKPKQQKVEGKEKEVLEEKAAQPTQKKTNSCTQVFTRRSKGIVIKESAVEKDLASTLAKANQVITSQRQEITALSIKAYQDAVFIITQEIPVHLSSPVKKKKLATEKERAIKIKQEQTLQVEAAMEAKKKAIHDEEEKRRIELERRQKAELDAKRKVEIEHKNKKK